jgi:hypothetical protein
MNDVAHGAEPYDKNGFLRHSTFHQAQGNVGNAPGTYTNHAAVIDGTLAQQAGTTLDRLADNA